MRPLVKICWSLLLFCMPQVGCGGCDREVYVKQSGAMITVNPTLLDFGEIPRGLVVTKTIEILNPGQTALVFESTSLDDENGVFMVTLPQEQVGVSDSIFMTVTFMPTALQEYEATYTLITNAENHQTTLLTFLGEGTPDSFCGDCDNPPENQCLSEHDLLIFENVGACVNDECQYQATQIYCEFGCDEDSALCLDDSGNVLPDPVDSGIDPEPDPEPELDSGIDPEPEPELDSGIDPEPEPELDSGIDPEPEPELDSGIDPEPEPELDSGIDPELDSGIDPEVDSGIDPEVDSGIDPELDSGIDPELDSGIDPEVDSGIDPEFEVDAGMIGSDTGPLIEEIRAAHQGMTCARLLNGTVKCWGYNVNGQLGIGEQDFSTPQPNPNPVPQTVALPQGTFATGLAASHSATIATTDDGTLYAWGACHHLHMSNTTYGNKMSPIVVPSVGAGRALGVGRQHSCVASDSGVMSCWGSNYRAGLGTGDDIFPTDQPVEIAQLDDVTQVALGSHHTCALQGDNKMFCWGYNHYYQVGEPATEDEFCPSTVVQPDIDAGPTNAPSRCVLSPREIQGLESGDILDIAAGENHTCVVMADSGKVFCWGNNQGGAVGDGHWGGQLFYGDPTETSDLGLPAVKLALGNGYSLALLEDGSIKGWGTNSNGQLGDGTSERQLTPVSVVGLPLPALQISAASGHSCAVLEDHSAWCWGKNDYGQLGDGTTEPSLVPVRVEFPEDPESQLDAGMGD